MDYKECMDGGDEAEVETGETIMFYAARAYNSNEIIFWATASADVEKYVNFLNRDREINVYAAHELGATGYEDVCVMSCDEPHWDDFMNA